MKKLIFTIFVLSIVVTWLLADVLPFRFDNQALEFGDIRVPLDWNDYTNALYLRWELTNSTEIASGFYSNTVSNVSYGYNGQQTTASLRGTYSATGRGGCVRLDGVDDYMNTIGPGMVSGATQYTVAVWFNADDFSDDWAGLFCSRDASMNGLSFVDDTAKLHFHIMGSGGPKTPDAFSAGTWYFVVAVFNGNAYGKIYVNGALVVSNTTVTASITNADYWRVGVDDYSVSERLFDGFVDEIMYWRRVVESNEQFEIWEEYKSDFGY